MGNYSQKSWNAGHVEIEVYNKKNKKKPHENVWRNPGFWKYILFFLIIKQELIKCNLKELKQQ